MTDEPTYEYVKGKGWIVVQVPFVDFIDVYGYPFRIEHRRPNDGEQFVIGFKHWTLADFKTHCECFGWGERRTNLFRFEETDNVVAVVPLPIR